MQLSPLKPQRNNEPVAECSISNPWGLVGNHIYIYKKVKVALNYTSFVFECQEKGYGLFFMAIDLFIMRQIGIS